MQSFQLSSDALIAIQASLDGGAAILEVYHNETTEVELKGDESPLTQADLRSNSAIMKWLEQSDHPVLSEEGKHLEYKERKQWSTLWIVDPLDGTKEFIKRNGEFTVNVALVKDGRPLLGVVYVPVTGELYLGINGQGASGGTFGGPFSVDSAAAANPTSAISSDIDYDGNQDLVVSFASGLFQWYANADGTVKNARLVDGCLRNSTFCLDYKWRGYLGS